MKKRKLTFFNETLELSFFQIVCYKTGQEDILQVTKFRKTNKFEMDRNTNQRKTMELSSKYLTVLAALTATTFVNGFTTQTPWSSLPQSSLTPFISNRMFRGNGPLYDYIDSSNEPSKESTNEDESLLTPSLSTPAENSSTQNHKSGGRITLVGSGPGDPDLLTMAAYRIITDPSVFIVADRLVSPEILDLIQGEYKIARKLPGCAEKAQHEIFQWCEDALNEGKHVIRLKIGDPFVFGRGGEEVLTFRGMGYEPVVIPGVSAAFAAPLLGNIPVTHRGVSNQVVMCTGYGRNGTSPDLIQYHPEQTVVFLMAVGRLHELCQNLINMAGYPSKTPVAIVEKAGCPEQRTLVGDMEDIGDLAQEYEIKPPSTIVVGEVVNVLLSEDDEKPAHGLISTKINELNIVIDEN